MLYGKPTVLNRERHAKLRLKREGDDYRFASQTTSAPLAITEISPAARDYPIFFVESPRREILPVALLGVKPQENRFVTAEGGWRPSYIPAFVRRYPFILSDDNSVVIDEAYPGFGEDGEELFDENGKNAPLLDRTITFLAQYQTEIAQSQAFCRKLADLGLLKAWGVQVLGNAGEHLMLDGMSVVDTKRLGEIEDAKVCELFRAGELALVYAHLFSLANIATLSDRPTGPSPTKQ